MQVARAGCTDHFVERLRVLRPPVMIWLVSASTAASMPWARSAASGRRPHAGAQRGVENVPATPGVSSEGETS